MGTGVQTRSVRCADPSGCAPRKVPEDMRSCIPKQLCEAQDGEWFVGKTFISVYMICIYFVPLSSSYHDTGNPSVR